MRTRTILAILGIALVAGGAYGFWQYSRGSQQAQTANVSDAVTIPHLTGTWTSTDDPSYQLTFETDGTVREQYGTSTVSTGTYHYASSPDGYVTGTFDSLGPTDYLLEDVDGEKYAYRVLELTDTALQLSYLDRGNTLSFSR